MGGGERGIAARGQLGAKRQEGTRGHGDMGTWGIPERPGGSEARLTRRDSAKVQIGAELLCKGERGEAARGHVGMVTWGQGEEAVLKGGIIRGH